MIEADRDFQIVADSIPQMIWVTRADGYHELYNRRWYEYTGLTPEQSFAEGWSTVLHPDDFDRTTAVWTRSLATGEPYDIEYRFRRHDGVYRWFLGSARALRSADGEIARWYGTLTDIDERINAEETLRFLLDASSELGGVLDLDATLETLVKTIVPRLAEWALIYLRDEDGAMGLRAIGHADPELAARAHEALTLRDEPLLAEATASVVRARDSRIIGLAAGELFPLAANGSAARDVAIASAIVVPLRTGGEVTGVVQLVNTSSGSAATDDRRRIADALAARASVALDNASLYERERQIARTFQNAALPATLPQMAGMPLDAAYQAASNEALVGGDWYDALRLSDGRVVVSIGDVSGHGLGAAVTMQAMRLAVRTIAHVHADPITILDAADRTLRNESPDRIVTAFVGVYDPIERELRYALAGHPPPLIRRANGDVVTLASPGLPLGLRDSATDESHAIGLEEGDLVVLYTDGVIEATRDIFEGERRLEAAVRATTAEVARPAHRVLARAVPGDATDDIAILTFRITDAADSIARTWTFASADAASAQLARDEFVAILRASGVSDRTLLYNARVVFGEMVGNVTRHAPGPVDVTLEIGADVVLHVLDRGAGFVLSPHLPSDALAERGRGLYLIWSLTNEVNVSRRTQGGSHARAVVRTRA